MRATCSIMVIRSALVAGAFSDCLEERRNAVDPWKTLPEREDGWSFMSSLDWGSAAPAYFALAAQSPGAEWEGRWFARGSYVIFAEAATNRPGSLTQGMNYNVTQTIELMRATCQRWGLDIEGYSTMWTMQCSATMALTWAALQVSCVAQVCKALIAQARKIASPALQGSRTC